MNAWSILERLFWAGFAALVATAIALLVGRISQIHPSVKVWICRLVFVKSMVCILWAATFVLAGATGSHAILLPAALAWYLLGAWIVGMVLVFTQLIKSCRAAARLRLLSRPLQSTGTELRSCDGLTEPCVVGMVRPCIVMPTDLNISDAVLAHELAHVRNRDLLWNAIAWSAYAVLWFVPGLGRLTQEMWLWQEARADMMARSEAAIAPEDQARLLLSFASRPAPVSVAMVAMSGHARVVDRRIRAMFNTRFSAWVALGVVTLALFAFVPFKVQAGHAGSRARARVKSPITLQMLGRSTP